MDALPGRQGFDDYVASYAHIAHIGITNNVDTHPATTIRGPITDPERRHAPTTLAPWTDGCDILDEIFHILRVIEATGDAEIDSPSARFPSRDHVEETGFELPVINSEAAVHFFDYDTIYKPAKKIIDSALSRSTLLRTALSVVLHRRRLSASTIISTNQTGQVVFSPHSRTVTVPTRVIGQKRKRSRSALHVSSSGSDSEEHTSTEDDESEGIMDEIQVSVDPHLSSDLGGNHEKPINVKSGPGDFYCSFVSTRRTSNTNPNRNPPFSHLLLVGEAKAPHKLTRGLIQSALGENNITIDIRQFIERHSDSHSRSPPPSSADINARGSGGSADYDADQRWLAAVATQIYSSLLNKRLRYGYITTGASYILVRIRPGQATTLEYMLLPALRHQIPREVEGREQAWLDWLATTPLGRISCLTLLSLFGDGQLTDVEVAQTKAAIPAMIWKTPRHREQSLGTGSFRSTASTQTRGSDPEWTERAEQSRKRACDVGNADAGEAGSGHRHKRACPMNDSEDESDSQCQHKRACIGDNDDEQQHPKATGRLVPPLKQLTPPREAKQEDIEVSMDEVPFCSSRCLCSLTSEGTTDPLCPNWTIHANANQRPTSVAQLRTLARTCVALPSYIQADCNTEEDPPVLMGGGSKNAIYMGLYGASSALFKVRVGSYVLAAKAARSVHPTMDKKMLQRLRLEAAAYKKLHTLQGHGIPICLGLVDVSPSQSGQADRSAHASKIAHFSGFLLLSWAGSPLLNTCTNKDIDQERTWLARLRVDVDHHLSQMHSLGILHGDAELRNIVVTSDSGDHAASVYLVDFERALTKGRFARRLARHNNGMDEKDIDQRFQQACRREKMLCLEQWDDWTARRREKVLCLEQWGDWTARRFMAD